MTVLKVLKKLKHPNVHHRWMKLRDLKKSSCHQHISRKHSYCWRENKECSEDILWVSMAFSNHDKRYDFSIRKNVCSIQYCEREPRTFFSHEVKLSIDNCPYDMLDSTLFQQSLLGSSGMITDQELDMLVQVRDVYFGE